MDWLRLLFCAVLVTLCEAGNETGTFTYEMVAKCKEHICKHGYKYETFYKIDAEDREHVKSDASVALEMHIAILAANNGHILLSTKANPTVKDPVYEIVVGGGGNKFTELRRNLRRNGKISKPTVGILSAIEFRPFFIRITTDGAVQFGKEGEEPFLDYRDNNPLAIRYFSFAAWSGVEAKFCYDCPPEGTNSSTTNSEAVDPLMSNADKLKAALLQDRAPHLPPSSPVIIRLGFKITSLKYSPFTSKMVTGVAIVASWVDDSMAWNPDKFNNITKLTFSDGQIWRPTFFLFNSEDQGSVDIDNPGPITMVNSGEATYYFQTHLTSWCFNYAKTTNNWPHDDYHCSIVIAPWEPHEKIILEQISHANEKMAVFSESSKVIPNEWNIEWKQGVVEPSAWHTIFTANDNDTNQSDRFLVNISLSRRATAFNVVFYTPLLVLVLFVLMSFWSEPLQMSRVWFYAGCTVVICVGLCYVDYLVPIHTVPTILVLYVTVLGGVLLALLLQVLLMTSTAERLCQTHLVQSLLRSKMFRIIFFLPPVKSAENYDRINEAYSGEEDEVTPPRNGNIPEMETETATPSERDEVAAALDWFLFLVYSLVIAVMLSMHF
ncbi:acetylcholine receptor subunit alpha [Leguminivora glycinivorella]|uniref:acetylcholine receptor subunit alpha n=1 Tax=Leguminivora glycinivorella TaxID=1035111 RepID=UPI00200EE2EB|nr:acetylcholine receptor subunit alpha [Leguminivora glycinivorella]